MINISSFTIKQFVEELPLEYIDRHRSDCINFRCPFCGDSQKSKFKRRGYVIYTDSSAYYICHNCDVRMGIFKFIQLLDVTVYNRFKREVFQGSFNDFVKPKPKKLKVIVDVENDTEDLQESDDNKSKIPLRSIVNYHAKSKGAVYLTNRRIPKLNWNDIYYFKGNVYQLYQEIFNDDKYKRKADKILDHEGIVVPFYNIDRELYGFTLRSTKEKGMRYVTLGVDNIESGMFGIDIVDFTLKFYIVEGIFDRLSFNPCNQIMAMKSSNPHIDNIPKEYLKNATYIFDNEYHNKELLKPIKKVILKGINVVLFDENFKYKDINEALNNGVTEDELRLYFDKRQFKGLGATIELDRLAHISKSKKHMEVMNGKKTTIC